MQYFSSLGEFSRQPIIHPFLFVNLLKKISQNDINEMTKVLLQDEQEVKEEEVWQAGEGHYRGYAVLPT